MLLACRHPAQLAVPGSTTKAVSSVAIESVDGNAMALDFGPLRSQLGLRSGNIILPPRDFNVFRLAEDRRRITAFAAIHGYFEAETREPQVTHKSDGAVSIRWTIALGQQYRIGAVKLEGAPAVLYDELLADIPFGKGAQVLVDDYRSLRHSLADALRWQGYSHARVYSRAWIHRESKTVDWYYIADPGPKTQIAAIEVQGNRRVPAQAILERSGLRVGEGFGERERIRAQLALMDAGSMASVVILSDEDIHKGPPESPDSGGQPQVDDQGDLKARRLASGLHLQISVIERPRREMRVQVGSEVDPSRSDVFAETRVVFRDLATAGLHFVSEGLVAYGYELGGSSQPLGVYGTASSQIIKTSVFGSSLDLRTVASLEHQLFPSAAVREYAAGPGFRTRLADKLYLDVDLRAFAARETDALELDAMERASAGLAQERSSHGTLASASIVRDARDNGIEATDGYFASAFAEHAPSWLAATHSWTRLGTDLRAFHPLSAIYSVATRLSGSWLLGAGDAGIPLHRRLFGGGSYGFRGYGRQELSPQVGGVRVGGESLVEASLEARMLEPRQLYGAVAFVDVGAASLEHNPLANGVSSAIGIGGRVRTFYIPIAIDLSYRLVEDNGLLSPLHLSPWSVFLRLGEAF